jgi:5'(3')-deoxyribonucleotidase
MNIYLDCDGVLANWTSEANEWLGLPKNAPWTEWDGSGIDWERLDDAMSNVSFWKDMEVLTGAKKLYNNLKRLGKVQICTRPFPHPNCLYGRAVWLQEHFGITPKDTIYIHDKWHLANRDSILIDDNTENCSLFKNYGGYAILYPQLYNTSKQHSDKVEYVLNEALTICKGAQNG